MIYRVPLEEDIPGPVVMDGVLNLPGEIGRVSTGNALTATSTMFLPTLSTPHGPSRPLQYFPTSLSLYAHPTPLYLSSFRSPLSSSNISPSLRSNTHTHTHTELIYLFISFNKVTNFLIEKK